MQLTCPEASRKGKDRRQETKKRITRIQTCTSKLNTHIKKGECLFMQNKKTG